MIVMAMDGPVVVEFGVFQACKPSPSAKAGLASNLAKQYACFRDEPRRAHTHTHSRRHDGHAPEKPRIGNRELSREAIARKDFLALLNKLSPQNACAIIAQTQTSLRCDCIGMYVDMIWDAMQRSPEFQGLYVDMLAAIDEKHSVFGDVQRIWEAYLVQKPWTAVAASAASDAAAYDEFCDHVKAKKRTIASIRGWIGLVRRRLCKEDVGISLIGHLMDAGPTDMSLDGLMEFCRAQAFLTAHVQSTIQDWHSHAQQLPPMTRFKLYDLWEKMNPT